MKRFKQDILNGPLFPNIVSYTIPIILTSVLQLLFNAADLVVVGQYCGSVSVGAVGATGSITNLIISLFIGLSVGAGVSTAHAIGCRDEKAMHRTVHTALPLALVSGIILTVVGVTFSETFLRWMNTPENVLPLSTIYIRIYFGGITFNMVYNFSAAILRAAGDTKGPLIYLSIAGVVNVILNIFFVAVCGMNVDGVALATTISQGISAVLVVRALMKRTDACRFHPKQMRFYKAQFVKMMRLGIPAGIQSSMFSISNVIVQSSVNSFSDIVVSGNAAAANIEGFAYACMNAFQQTTLNFVGQNMGAGQYKRVKKIHTLCLGCVTIVGLVASGTLYALAPTLLPIYITDSAEAIEYGILRMTYVCIPYFLCGTMDVTGGALRGLGASFTPMLISVLGVCGMRIGWIMTVFQMPQYHTLDCLYISYPISWLLTFTLELGLFFLLMRKHSKAPHPLPKT